MSFGFSVGDFFAVGHLIYEIYGALRNSEAEYRELIIELEMYTLIPSLIAKTTAHAHTDCNGLSKVSPL